jgi:hypothetical protein
VSFLRRENGGKKMSKHELELLVAYMLGASNAERADSQVFAETMLIAGADSLMLRNVSERLKAMVDGLMTEVRE